MSERFAGTVLVSGNLVNRRCKQSESWVLPEESPIVLRINGDVYAVMLATPLDLIDFARGFCLSEGLVKSNEAIVSIEAHEIEHGYELEITLSDHAFVQFELLERRRRLAGASGCGICGLNAISHVTETLPEITASVSVSISSIITARSHLRDQTPLNQESFSVHAAALVDLSGKILLVREDIGRHNALDKLIGAVGLSEHSFERSFVLLTSRFAFELAQKCVRMAIPVAISISAPSAMAIESAKKANMTLASFSGKGELMVFSGIQRISQFK